MKYQEPYKTTKQLTNARRLVNQYLPGKYEQIVELTLNTGASLASILSITNEQVNNEEIFCFDDNPIQSYPLERLPKPYSGKKPKGLYFASNTDEINRVSISATFSKLSKKLGEEISLMRFQKTYYYNWFLKHHSLRDNSVFRDGSPAYVCKYFNITREEYDRIVAGNGPEPIINEFEGVFYEDPGEIAYLWNEINNIYQAIDWNSLSKADIETAIHILEYTSIKLRALS